MVNVSESSCLPIPSKLGCRRRSLKLPSTDESHRGVACVCRLPPNVAVFPGIGRCAVDGTAIDEGDSTDCTFGGSIEDGTISRSSESAVSAFPSARVSLFALGTFARDGLVFRTPNAPDIETSWKIAFGACLTDGLRITDPVASLLDAASARMALIKLSGSCAGADGATLPRFGRGILRRLYIKECSAF